MFDVVIRGMDIGEPKDPVSRRADLANSGENGLLSESVLAPKPELVDLVLKEKINPG